MCSLRHVSWQLPNSAAPDSSVGKESACNVGDPGLIPGSGRSPGEGKDYPIQYSGLENSMNYTVHGLTKSWTRLSNFHFQERLKEKAHVICLGSSCQCSQFKIRKVVTR